MNHSYNMRMMTEKHITLDLIKKAIHQRNLPLIIQPYTEIDVPTDMGKAITVVCAYVWPDSARFVSKDALCEIKMNQASVFNKVNYLESEGRLHLLEAIYPHISQEWRALIKPRKITEIIDDQTVKYADPLWIPSATDVFGPPTGTLYLEEADSFGLPIFKKARDRVKECKVKVREYTGFKYNEKTHIYERTYKEDEYEGTFDWYLRTVDVTNPDHFCVVMDSGWESAELACCSLGLVSGFDI